MWHVVTTDEDHSDEEHRFIVLNEAHEAIAYCDSKEDAEEVAAALNNKGVR